MSILEIIGAIYIGLTIGGLALFISCIIGDNKYKNHNKKNITMEQKKETNAQLKRRINNAVVHVERTKESKEVYFDDKGLRLMYNDDFAIVGTFSHTHVFNAITSNGASRPYLFVRRMVDIALENDCIVTDEKGNKQGYSYAKMMQTLKDKKDEEGTKEYNLCWFTDLWLFNIFAPLYSIDETILSTTLVYEQYVHNIACNSIILSEKKEDMTNKQYIDSVCDCVKDYTSNMKEEVLFNARTDEQLIAEAMKQDELDDYMKEEENESKIQETES